MDDQVRDGGVASCAWLRGSAEMPDAVIWRLIEGASRRVLAGTPEKDSVSAAATCGVTGTRRRNRWQSRHGVMVQAPVWDRACAHTRGGQPCSTGSGAAGGRMRLRNNLSPSWARASVLGLETNRAPRADRRAQHNRAGRDAKALSSGPCAVPSAARVAGSDG